MAMFQHSHKGLRDSYGFWVEAIAPTLADSQSRTAREGIFFGSNLLFHPVSPISRYGLSRKAQCRLSELQKTQDQGRSITSTAITPLTSLV